MDEKEALNPIKFLIELGALCFGPDNFEHCGIPKGLLHRIRPLIAFMDGLKMNLQKKILTGYGVAVVLLGVVIALAAKGGSTIFSIFLFSSFFLHFHMLWLGSYGIRKAESLCAEKRN